VQKDGCIVIALYFNLIKLTPLPALPSVAKSDINIMFVKFFNLVSDLGEESGRAGAGQSRLTIKYLSEG
jgi:hypothetical protein